MLLGLLLLGLLPPTHLRLDVDDEGDGAPRRVCWVPHVHPAARGGAALARHADIVAQVQDVRRRPRALQVLEGPLHLQRSVRV